MSYTVDVYRMPALLIRAALCPDVSLDSDMA